MDAVSEIDRKIARGIIDFHESFDRLPNRVYLTREDAAALGLDLTDPDPRVGGMQARLSATFSMAFRDRAAPDNDTFASTYSGLSARGESTIAVGLGLSKRSGGRGSA